SFVDLSIYNAKGQLVDCICKETQNAGRHTYRWNPNGKSTGIYFIKLTAENYTDIQRCVYSQ
ncbi:T9SS C-terminal target domain-containing protein, partial [candidate division KSB1 bacterium]